MCDGSNALIDSTGRRYWFTAAFFLTAAGLIWLWAFGAATAFGMLLGFMFCSAWLGSMNMTIFLYTAEIYPTRMRALGVSWGSFWLRAAATVGPLIVGFVLPRYGISGVFLAFSIFAIIGGIAATFMIETRRACWRRCRLELRAPQRAVRRRSGTTGDGCALRLVLAATSSMRPRLSKCLRTTARAARPSRLRSARSSALC